MTLLEQVNREEPELRQEAIIRAQAYLRKRAEEKIMAIYKADTVAIGVGLVLLAVLVWFAL